MIQTPFDLAPLGSICELNPRLSKESRPADTDLVSFVPMAAVDEESASIRAAEVRAYSAVKKGFTPFRENDVLFAKITPCMENGKAALARGLQGGIGFGSTEFHVLRASSRVLPEWLRYYVLRPAFRSHAKRRMSGAVGQQRVPAEFLSESLIPIPPVEEQRRLVELLSRAENIVRMRREAEQKAKEIIPALFLDMFGDPATNPRGWVSREIGEEADIQGGLQVTTKRATLPLEVPYLRVANVHRTHLDLSEIKLIRATEGELARTRLRAGDLLVIEGHGNPAEIGRVGIWPGGIDPCVHQNHLIRVRCRPDSFDSVYVWAYLNSASGRRFLLREGKTTSGLNTISVSNVKGVAVPMPPIKLQKQFAERIADCTALQGSQKMASIRANHTFQSLLAGAFSEVRAT